MQTSLSVNSVAGAAWKVVKPHVPMIRFKKGGLTDLVRDTLKSSAAGGGAVGAPGGGKGAAPPVEVRPVLEEWQVPHRYRREVITQEEIDYINRGGPE